jgi:hypothetical protein
VTDLASTNDEISAQKNNIFNFFLTDSGLVKDQENNNDDDNITSNSNRIEGALTAEKITEILKQIRNSFKVDLNNLAQGDKRDILSSSPIFSSQHSPVMLPHLHNNSPTPLQERIHEYHNQARMQRMQHNAKSNLAHSPSNANTPLPLNSSQKITNSPNCEIVTDNDNNNNESTAIPLPIKLRHSFSSFPTFVGFDELMDELDNPFDSTSEKNYAT